MRLCGQIGKLQVLILVDSCSVCTFIIQQLAQQLSVPTSACEPSQFVTADGSPMVCDKRTEHLQWSYQGHTFVSNVGILRLKCFDMILGGDWIESCSPMWIHWTNKQIKFTHHGKRILLKGLNHDVEHCPSVKEAKLRGLLKRQALTHCIQFQFASEPHIQWE
jgi:hypothetical protein